MTAIACPTGPSRSRGTATGATRGPQAGRLDESGGRARRPLIAHVRRDLVELCGELVVVKLEAVQIEPPFRLGRGPLVLAGRLNRATSPPPPSGAWGRGASTSPERRRARAGDRGSGSHPRVRVGRAPPRRCMSPEATAGSRLRGITTRDLGREEAADAPRPCSTDAATSLTATEFLIALQREGRRRGRRRGRRVAAVGAVPPVPGAVDIVGTGGDVLQTPDVSTIAGSSPPRPARPSKPATGRRPRHAGAPTSSRRCRSTSVLASRASRR